MINEPSYLKLLQNIAFLISLVLIFDLMHWKVGKGKVIAKKILIGVLIGGIGILIMLTPWVLSPGIVFDTRSVLLSVSGLFFGTIPTVIAMIITATLRLNQGGGGTLMGLLVILFSGSLGILWHHLRKEPLNRVKWWQLFLFGVLIHLIMLILMYTLPKENINQALSILGPPVLIIYPIGTLLLGLFLRNRLKREQVKKKLVDVTERLNKTQQLSKIGGWEFDVDSKAVFWTDEVYLIHGYSPDDFPQGSTELMDKSVICYHPEDRKVILDAFQECINLGKPYDLELRITSITGEEKWVRTIAEAVFEDDKVKKINGTIMDITEKKKAADEFLEINADFRSLVELAPVGIVIYDNNNRNYFINRKFSEITGYKQEDIPILSDWWSKAYPDINYRNQIMQQWYSAVEFAKASDTTIEPVEARVHKKDGDYCYLDIGYVSSLEKNIATFVDITKRKVAEQELLESEKRYHTLLNSAPAGIVVISNNKIDYINPAGLQILGANPDENLIGKPIIEFIHPKMLEITRDNMQKLSNDEGLVINFENIFLKVDRSPLYVQTIGTRILFEGKDAIQVIVTDISNQKAAEEKRSQDQEILQKLLADAERSRQSLLSLIEDQRASEDQIRKLNQELEQRVKARTAQLEASNKELEAFAYSVSHDLRAPLRGIDGFSQILEKEHAHSLNEEGRRILGVVRKSAQKMNLLIIDLLALSRVRQNEMQYSEINMASMVKHVMEELATPSVMEKFEFIIKDLPVINADSTLIRQVWVNLISNAIKYTSPKENGKIEIEGYEEDDCVTYVVRDNGVGYDSRYADKLFGLFQRLHSERDFEGSGIGLAIVARIIKRHNGRVWSKSEMGNGAEFYFSIPKVRGE